MHSTSNSVDHEDLVSEVSDLSPAVSPIDDGYTQTPNHNTTDNDPNVGTWNGRLVEQEDYGAQKEPGTEEKGAHVDSRCSYFAKRSWLWDWWLWEIAAIVLSLGVTAATVVILVMYEGQPLPSWPYNITLNAMLSVLSTIAKSSMLLAATQCISQSKWLLFGHKPQRLTDFHIIDEASRGPVGALALMFRLKGRALLASAGAFVVLTSLALDPFTQQALTYPVRSIVVTQGKAPNIPRMQNWSSPLTNYPHFLYARIIGNIESTVPLSMKAAIYNTLLNRGVTESTLNFNCPTGNCTFDPITTLGFCSTCQDLTATFRQKCCKMCDDGKGNNTFPCCDLDQNRTSEQPTWRTVSYINCSYYQSTPDEDDRRDPNGFALWLDTKLSRENNESSGSTTPPKKSSALVQSTNMTTAANETGSTFISVPAPMIAFARAIANDTLPGLEIKANITGCALSMCVQTLNTTVRNGILRQIVTSTWRNDSLNQPAGGIWLKPPTGRNSTKPAGDSSFYIDGTSQEALTTFLRQVLTTNVTTTYVPPELTKHVPIPPPPIEYATDIAEALWITDDLGALMSNLADRMTDTLRGLSTESVSGTAYELQPRVAVNWGWLILPITLVLLSCVLLIIVIVSSHMHHTAAWKSNCLATLYHGLSTPKDDIAHVAEACQMKTAAEDRRVQLKLDTDNVLRLLDSQ